MKKIILSTALVFLSSVSFAQNSYVPEGVSYYTIQNNFDGSKTIQDPKVKVNGTDSYLGLSSGPGFCKLFKMSFVAAGQSRSYFPITDVVVINSKGQLAGYPTTYHGTASDGTVQYDYLTQITCR